MKPLIGSFFVVLLIYSLFFDKEGTNGKGYEFGLKNSLNHEQRQNYVQPQDTLEMFAVTPVIKLDAKEVI